MILFVPCEGIRCNDEAMCCGMLDRVVAPRRVRVCACVWVCPSHSLWMFYVRKNCFVQQLLCIFTYTANSYCSNVHVARFTFVMVWYSIARWRWTSIAMYVLARLEVIVCCFCSRWLPSHNLVVGLRGVNDTQSLFKPTRTKVVRAAFAPSNQPGHSHGHDAQSSLGALAG